MPNGTETRPTGIEEAAFIKWLGDTQGTWRALSLQMGFSPPWWENNQYYDAWVDQGRPGFVGKTIAPAEWWELTPEEQSERLYDLSSEPFPASEGTHWETTRYDERGEPVKEQWNLVADEEAEPTKETWATEGKVVVPGQLLRMPDDTFVDYNGFHVDTDTALTMIQSWLGTKTDDTLTAAEETELKLSLDRLAWEKEQYGTLSASERAQISLTQQSLGLRRQEWLAGLQASPATFIERWYAEHLPPGTQMPEEYPWGAPAAGTEAWAQQRFGEYAPEVTGEQWVPTAGAAPTEGWAPTLTQAQATSPQTTTSAMLEGYLIPSGILAGESPDFWLQPMGAGTPETKAAYAEMQSRAAEISRQAGFEVAIGEIKQAMRRQRYGEEERLAEEWGMPTAGLGWRHKVRQTGELPWVPPGYEDIYEKAPTPTAWAPVTTPAPTPTTEPWAPTPTPPKPKRKPLREQTIQEMAKTGGYKVTPGGKWIKGAGW